MRIDSRDRICRHLAAPGSGTTRGSQFGKFMKDAGIRLPNAVGLQDLIERGWIDPVLRVPLPPTAINSWRDFPQLSMNAEGCPESETWALNLWTASHTMPHPCVGPPETWSLSYLDDEASPTTVAALSAAIPTGEGVGTPPPIIHESSGREAPSYIDFFAYWQALHVAELIDIAAISYYAIDATGISEKTAQQQAEFTRARAARARKRWDERRPVFEWLSRFRTLLASWAASNEEWDAADRAVRSMAERFSISPETVRAGLRDVLLTLWSDWTHDYERRHPCLRAALRLLQDDIAMAVHLLETLTGEAVDPTDSPWASPDRQARRWSDLLEALPREDWLARASFSRQASQYLVDVEPFLGSAFPLESSAIEAATKRHWRTSRPLRRLCLAFDRLHRELGNQGRSAAFDWRAPIRQKERIEQLLLLPLHAERLLTAVHRRQPGAKHYPDVRTLARARLDRALRMAEVGGAQCRAAIKRLNELMDERAQLHERDFESDELFVHADDVGLASDMSNALVAAHVNFVVARNYAAHHDALDADLIYPTDGDPTRHAGRVAIESLLTVVMCAVRDL